MATLVNPTAGAPLKRKLAHWETIRVRVKAGETFAVGAPLKMDSSGTCVAIGNAEVGANELLGFACESAATALAAGREISVDQPLAGAQIALPLYHATAASAVWAEADFDLSLTYPLEIVSGVLGVDIAQNGTNDAVRLIERANDQPWGEQYGLVWCEFLSGALERGTA